MSKTKKRMTPAKLCIGMSKCFLEFVEEVFSYQFEECPNYSKMDFLLSKVLYQFDVAPDLKFDWSMFKLEINSTAPESNRSNSSEDNIDELKAAEKPLKSKKRCQEIR